MTYQGTRVSLVLLERFLNSLRGAIFTLALGFGLYAGVSHFDGLCDAAGHLIGRLSQFEVSATSVKFGLNAESIHENAQQSAEIPESMKGLQLSNDLSSLKKSWAIRLLYVDDGGIKCDYANPTEEMAANLNIDRHLAVDGLIVMNDDAQLKAEAVKLMQTAKAAGRAWTIGEPRSCYHAKLTWRGANVKTALAEFLGAAFTAATATTTPEARQAQVKIASALPK
ncbi:hypothetical protein [Methylocystis parvus]|uniref:rRNA methylase n=1 Tax=Methylocystis parvus TaxID=134 RepID=A0A6B8MD87_9HYPH|nr:hypothetical protein [Methylocystis parvus]QGM98610.1 rRNA methylase [Methylocystis parvus]WBK01047.1 rRNA methylase [Methylocystis parvus OBBP]